MKLPLTTHDVLGILQPSASSNDALNIPSIEGNIQNSIESKYGGKKKRNSRRH